MSHDNGVWIQGCRYIKCTRLSGSVIRNSSPWAHHRRAGMWVAEDVMPWSEWYLNTVEARGFGFPDSDTYTSRFTRLNMSQFCWVWWKSFCTPSSCKVSSDKLSQNICFNIPSQWQTSPPRCVTHYPVSVSVCSLHRYALFMANFIRNRQKCLSVERGRYAIATRCWDNRDVLKHVAQCHGSKSQTGWLFMGWGF